MALSPSQHRRIHRGESGAAASPEVPVHFGRGQNPALSNLSDSPFEFRGRRFRTAEGAYQAHKTGVFVPGFENLSGPAAKGKGSGLRRGTDVRGLMLEVLEAKASQVPEFAKALLLTGNAPITHLVGYRFWRETFPELLMGVRERLRREVSQ